MAGNYTSRKIQTLRSDNGVEYVNNDFKNFLNDYGIRYQITICYTPEQNGVGKRVNRTIAEKARFVYYLLFDTKFSNNTGQKLSKHHLKCGQTFT